MNRNFFSRLAAGLSCLAIALLANQAYGQNYEFQVITTNEFSEVTASNAGVIYVSPLPGDSEAIFFFDGTSSQTIVQTGDLAPQGFTDDGSFLQNGEFTIFSDIFRSNSVLSLTDAGQVGFTTVEALANTGSPVTMPAISGSFLYDGASVISISRQTQSPFGAAPGANFPAGAAPPLGGFGVSATTNGPAYNNVGQAIFSGNLVVRDAVGTPSLAGVAVSIGDGTAAGSFTVARNGQELTGVTGITDPTLSLAKPASVQLNDSGLALFQGNIEGTDSVTSQVLSSDNLNDTALITTSDGVNFNVIARQGDPLPGGMGTFEDGLGNNVDLFRSVSLNNLGQVLFEINESFFSYDPVTDAVRELFNAATTVPESTADIDAGAIDSFGEVIATSVTPLTDSGLFAFSANLNVDTGDPTRDIQTDRGIYVADINSGEITQVAREGQVFGDDPSEFFGAVANAGQSTGLSLSEGVLGDFSDLSINEAGQVLFAADNIGITVLDATNVNDDPESGVFLFDPEDGLIEVVRGGDQFAGGVLARARNPNVLTEFSLDDSGRIVFEFELEDGTEGLAFATPISSDQGDFDGDGIYNCADVNQLSQAIASNANDLSFDVNGDGILDVDDLGEWLVVAGAAELASGNPFISGDVNLDGDVNSSDLGLLLNNFGTDSTDYCGGNLNADLHVDSSDLGLLLNVFGQSANASALSSAVPEPKGLAWISFVAVGVAFLRRRS